MRNRAAGILIENGKLLLMHRIKTSEGKTREYYVIPGGGIEEGETLEEATKRELKEEIGIYVELLSNNPLLTLPEEKGAQYFTLVKRVNGNIGTGAGPDLLRKVMLIKVSMVLKWLILKTLLMEP